MNIEIVEIILTKSHSKIYPLELSSGVIITCKSFISLSVSHLKLDNWVEVRASPIHISCCHPDALCSYCAC